jgi:hypothetical protein
MEQRRGRNKVHLGEKFGRLTTVREAGRDCNKNIFWECKCQCGGLIKVRATTLAKGHTRSCGCLRKERFNKLIFRHGLRKNRLYSVWAIMIQRCTNPKASGYKNYGGRGIKVCRRWRNFKYFFEDMASEYRSGLSIDRINNDKGYNRNNCRWATKSQQAKNRRTTKLL